MPLKHQEESGVCEGKYGVKRRVSRAHRFGLTMAPKKYILAFKICPHHDTGEVNGSDGIQHQEDRCVGESENGFSI